MALNWRRFIFFLRSYFSLRRWFCFINCRDVFLEWRRNEKILLQEIDFIFAQEDKHVFAYWSLQKKDKNIKRSFEIKDFQIERIFEWRGIWKDLMKIEDILQKDKENHWREIYREDENWRRWLCFQRMWKGF